MNKSTKSEVVAITGASAGVGRAVAKEFAKKGASIGLIARGLTGLEATKLEVEKLGGRAIILQADVSVAPQVDNAARRLEEAFGPIDIWINNAMVSAFSFAIDLTPDELRRITEVTYLGQVFGIQAALRSMQSRSAGCIVLVGSALSYRGIPLQSAYCAAKHAVHGFFESLRCELLMKKSGVHLTMVQLPAMNTPQFDWEKSRLPRKARPMGKIFQPEVAARAIYWAAHHKRRELYVGSPTVVAILGNKIGAWFADFVLAKTGYDGQQRDEAEDPNRPYNLWNPVERDAGARGSFTDSAHDSSLQTWIAIHRLSVSITLIVAGVAALLLFLRLP